MEMANYGYVYASDSKHMLMRGLEILQRNHSNAKIVIILSQSSATDLTDLMKIIWEKYNMLNVVALLLNIFLSTSKSISALEQRINKHYSTHRLDAILYNPFIENDDEKGRFYIFSGSKDNDLESVSKKILRMHRERTFNAYQHPLRVGMFNLFGLAQSVEDKNGSIYRYNLPDGEMINAVTKAINFKPIFINPPNNSMYGGVTQNGTFTGVLGLLEYGKVDVTFNVRVLKQYGQEHATFLPAIGDTKLSFVVPVVENTSKPTFFGILDNTVMISTCIIYGIILWMDYYLNKILSKVKSRTISSDIGYKGITLFGIMLLVSQKKPKIAYRRFLVGSLAIFSTIIAFVYQGNMVKILTVSHESNKFDTLQRLVDSGLKILVPIGLRNFLPNENSTDVDPIYYRLSQRRTLIDNYEVSYKQVAYKRDSALFSLGIFNENYRYALYSNKTGNSLIHVVDEAPTRTILAYMVLKESPFRDRINKVVLRLFEGGFSQKFLHDNWYKLSLKIGRIHQVENTFFSMDELAPIFMLFIFSCSICTAVFLAEIFIANFYATRKKRLKHKNSIRNVIKKICPNKVIVYIKHLLQIVKCEKN